MSGVWLINENASKVKTEMTRVVPLILLLIVVGCFTKTEKVNEASSYNESALKMFVLNTPRISEKNALNNLDSILEKAAPDSAIFRRTVSYLEMPFGDPNSTYRNENLFSVLLQAKMKSSWYDSTTKAQVRNKLYLIMQNRVGSAANDFTYMTPAGYKEKMYDLRSDFTLVYFYNPECNACKVMKAALNSSAVITDKVKSGELKILAVYMDKDEKIWLDHLNEIPSIWIQGRDEDDYLYKNKVYDLKAIPTIYLLDKEKKVLLKDCMSVRSIEDKLSITK